LVIFASAAMNLQDWTGRTRTVDDTARATPYAALAATPLA